MAGPAVLVVRVVEVVEETADARSLVLELRSGADDFTYRPGQFLTVRVPGEPGIARSYSLSSSPLTGEKPKITVKRVPDGDGSNRICDLVRAGDDLQVLAPAGRFGPREMDRDVLLLAAGSGITPVMSILKSCLHTGTGHVMLCYANRDPESVIFREELAELCRAYPERLTAVHWLEAVQGLPSAAAIRGLAEGRTDRAAYVCGPGPFMDAAVDGLQQAGMPRRSVHVERFASLQGNPFSEIEPVQRRAVDADPPVAATVEESSPAVVPVEEHLGQQESSLPLDSPADPGVPDGPAELDSTGPAGIAEVETPHEPVDPAQQDEGASRPDTGQTGTDPGGARRLRVTIDGDVHDLEWPADTHMLDVLLDAGIDAPFSCREGNCSACACVLVSGEVDMTNNAVLTGEDIADGIVLGCQAVPRSEQVEVDYDE